MCVCVCVMMMFLKKKHRKKLYPDQKKKLEKKLALKKNYSLLVPSIKTNHKEFCVIEFFSNIRIDRSIGGATCNQTKNLFEIFFFSHNLNS